MSSTLVAHNCNCLLKLPLTVDKETENVYHETCEGYIGHVTDFEPLNDDFWNDQLKERENAFVINGNHYRLGERTTPSRNNGMGGEHYRIKTLAGEVIDTVDLWHQGDLPEAYKPFVLDNAKFVRLVEVKEYLACPNCGTEQNRTECYKTTCRNVKLTNATKVDLK